MKEPSRAPFYAGIYPGLCDVARAHGYALAIHGTLQRDLDLLAVPWMEEAAAVERLVDAIREHLGALGYAELLEFQGLPADQAAAIAAGAKNPDTSVKPHGRRAWSLYLAHGSYIDLSVFPPSSHPCAAAPHPQPFANPGPRPASPRETAAQPPSTLPDVPRL